MMMPKEEIDLDILEKQKAGIAWATYMHEIQKLTQKDLLIRFMNASLTTIVAIQSTGKIPKEGPINISTIEMQTNPLYHAVRHSAEVMLNDIMGYLNVHHTPALMRISILWSLLVDEFEKMEERDPGWMKKASDQAKIKYEEMFKEELVI